MSFSDNLRHARLSKHLTQRELSIMCNIQVSTISHFENPLEKRLPSMKNLLKLAKALEVSCDYLFGKNWEET